MPPGGHKSLYFKRMIKKVVISIIHLYQRALSPDKGFFRSSAPSSGCCVMYPTCSNYMIGAINKHGVFVGVYRGVKRIFRCHPYQKKLIDEP